MEARGNIDWNKVHSTLLAIQEINPGFVFDNVLIGGSAAWFYRTLLERSKDRDFPAPRYNEEEEKTWLSKDIDFLGTKREDYPKELNTPAEGSPPIVKINGVWIDSPNEGLFLTKPEVFRSAIEVENTENDHLFKVASPIQLYREKKALQTSENSLARPQDKLHLQTLMQASKFLLCSLTENQNLNQKQNGLLFRLLKEVLEIAPELLEDKKLQKRLSAQLERLSKNPKTKAIYHLLKNQILKKPGQSGNDNETMPV